jgi:hypothetical protein
MEATPDTHTSQASVLKRKRDEGIAASLAMMMSTGQLSLPLPPPITTHRRGPGRPPGRSNSRLKSKVIPTIKIGDAHQVLDLPKLVIGSASEGREGALRMHRNQSEKEPVRSELVWIPQPDREHEIDAFLNEVKAFNEERLQVALSCLHDSHYNSEGAITLYTSRMGAKGGERGRVHEEDFRAASKIHGSDLRRVSQELKMETKVVVEYFNREMRYCRRTYKKWKEQIIVGRKFLQPHTNELGVFEGRVLSFNSASNLYTVMYEDGDPCDIDRETMVKLMNNEFQTELRNRLFSRGLTLKG